MIRKLGFLLALLLPIAAFAGQVTGQLQTSTGGPIANSTLTFTLSQPAILSGTAMVVPSTVSCYTSSTGNVVGLPDPLTTPILTTGAGSLPAGTYYVTIAYTGTPGDSIDSPEATVVLLSAGSIIVSAPTVRPASATGYKVYIGSTSGSETLQGTVTGWTSYSQSAALSAGASAPSTNASVCSIRFSDELIPTGTFYTVNLVNKSGSQYAGYPQTWCTYGGSGGTINVSQGAPTGNCGTSGVFYPTPILSIPTPQSLAGPLSAPEFDGNVNVLSGTSNFNNVIANLFTGPLTGNTNGTHTGAVVGTTVSATCSQVSAMKDVRCYAGATADVQLNAAVAALPANGGVIDARGYGSTAQTIAATVELGINSAPGKTVTLLVDPTTKFTCTITNGTPCWIVDGGSFIIAHGATVTYPNAGFTVSSTANTSNIVLFRNNIGANLVGGSVNGISIFGNPTATVTDALLGVQNALQITQFNNITISGAGMANAVGLKVYATSGSGSGNVQFNNLQVDMLGSTGSRPVWIGCAASASLTPVSCSTLNSVAFLGASALVHPSTGLPIVTVEASNGAAGTNAVGNIGFYGTQLESASATDIGILDDGAESLHVYGAYATCHTTCGADIIKLAQPAGTTLDGVDIRGVDNQGGWTNTLNNTVLSTTFPSASYTRLNYAYSLTGRVENVIENAPLAAKGGLTVGASGSTITDSRNLIQSVTSCSNSTTCSNTAWLNSRIIIGTVPLTAGAATVSGISPAFTNSTSFVCSAVDQTTLTNVVGCKPASASSISCSGTGTDVIAYQCTGN